VAITGDDLRGLARTSINMGTWNSSLWRRIDKAWHDKETVE